MGIFTFNSTLVKSQHVHAITLFNCTLIQGETGDYGPYNGYQIKVTHDTTGCGNPSSYFYLELKNDVFWSRISCEFEVEGAASCWGFNDGSYALDGNLQSYNESNYDIIPNYRAINSWEKTQFQSHNRVTACDNESNNFFHGSFQTGNPKRFLMRRRKNNLNNRGGLSHGRSCNNSGVYTIIRNIRIW